MFKAFLCFVHCKHLLSFVCFFFFYGKNKKRACTSNAASSDSSTRNPSWWRIGLDLIIHHDESFSFVTSRPFFSSPHLKLIYLLKYCIRCTVASPVGLCIWRRDYRSSLCTQTWQKIIVYSDVMAGHHCTQRHEWQVIVVHRDMNGRSSLYTDMTEGHQCIWRHNRRSSVYMKTWQKVISIRRHTWLKVSLYMFLQTVMTFRPDCLLSTAHVSPPSLPAGPVRNKGIGWRNWSKKFFAKKGGIKKKPACCKERGHRRNVQRKAA